MASATIEQEQASRFCQVPILGLPVHMIQIPDVVSVMTHWVTHERFRPHWVVVADMHAVVEAHNRADFRRMVRQADLTVPDGISLVKVAQWKGGAVRSRVAGTDLMKAFFFGTQGLGFRHYFYGDTDLTLERLTGNLTKQYPGLDGSRILLAAVSPVDGGRRRGRDPANQRGEAGRVVGGTRAPQARAVDLYPS